MLIKSPNTRSLLDWGRFTHIHCECIHEVLKNTYIGDNLCSRPYRDGVKKKIPRFVELDSCNAYYISPSNRCYLCSMTYMLICFVSLYVQCNILLLVRALLLVFIISRFVIDNNQPTNRPIWWTLA